MRVVAIDGGKEKEELCKKLGAEQFIDFTTCKDIVGEVMKITTYGGRHCSQPWKVASTHEDSSRCDCDCRHKRGLRNSTPIFTSWRNNGLCWPSKGSYCPRWSASTVVGS
jgi:Zn-dependent alcohol dehydrogenase